jgi:hypothetical protein
MAACFVVAFACRLNVVAMQAATWAVKELIRDGADVPKSPSATE